MPPLKAGSQHGSLSADAHEDGASLRLLGYNSRTTRRAPTGAHRRLRQRSYEARIPSFSRENADERRPTPTGVGALITRRSRVQIPSPPPSQNGRLRAAVVRSRDNGFRRRVLTAFNGFRPRHQEGSSDVGCSKIVLGDSSTISVCGLRGGRVVAGTWRPDRTPRERVRHESQCNQWGDSIGRLPFNSFVFPTTLKMFRIASGEIRL